jgi:rRNA-processing protein FCF1
MHHLVPVFAPSADDWLLARVREEDDPTRVVVVTADRKVAGRARQRGARVVSPRDFLERCSG